MGITLLLVYSIGFGNTAVLSEKFRFKDECDKYVIMSKKLLGDKFIAAGCSGLGDE